MTIFPVKWRLSVIGFYSVDGSRTRRSGEPHQSTKKILFVKFLFYSFFMGFLYFNSLDPTKMIRITCTFDVKPTRVTQCGR